MTLHPKTGHGGDRKSVRRRKSKSQNEILNDEEPTDSVATQTTIWRMRSQPKGATGRGGKKNKSQNEIYNDDEPADALVDDTAERQNKLDLKMRLSEWPADLTSPHASLRKLRPHFRAALAAGAADEVRFDVRQPHLIGPAVGVDLGRVAATMIAAIDQHSAHAGCAHFAEGDLCGYVVMIVGVILAKKPRRL